MNEIFRKFAHRTSAAAGSPWAFLLTAATIVVWVITGPLFHFSDTWQLVNGAPPQQAAGSQQDSGV